MKTKRIMLTVDTDNFETAANFLTSFGAFIEQVGLDEANVHFRMDEAEGISDWLDSLPPLEPMITSALPAGQLVDLHGEVMPVPFTPDPYDTIEIANMPELLYSSGEELLDDRASAGLETLG